jgi:hypothetical protein
MLALMTYNRQEASLTTGAVAAVDFEHCNAVMTSVTDQHILATANVERIQQTQSNKQKHR